MANRFHYTCGSHGEQEGGEHFTIQNNGNKLKSFMLFSLQAGLISGILYLDRGVYLAGSREHFGGDCCDAGTGSGKNHRAYAEKKPANRAGVIVKITKNCKPSYKFSKKETAFNRLKGRDRVKETCPSMQRSGTRGARRGFRSCGKDCFRIT